MNQWMLATGALLAGVAVICGAFGAHALQGVLSNQARGWYDTAVTYHTTHSLAIIACALAALHSGSFIPAWFTASAVCFLIGITLFSGSLYAMAFSGITKLGMITPIGGLFLIAGWLCLAIAALKISPGGNS